MAVVESVEEAILNSLVAAETMVGRDHHVAHALPRDELASLLARYQRTSPRIEKDGGEARRIP